MDRLTEVFKNEDGVLGFSIIECKMNTCEVICKERSDCKNCPVQQVIKKLAEYEDLEEQGKLLKLPCKVGDMVFDLVLCDDSQYRIFEMRVCNINYFGDVHKGKVWNVYLEDECSKAYRSFYDFGKTVFLTHEQAELALKGLKER